MFEIGKPDLTAETRKELPGSFVELKVGVTHYELSGDIGSTSSTFRLSIPFSALNSISTCAISAS